MSEGPGDRHGVPSSRAGGDRQNLAPVIRARAAQLVGLDGRTVAFVTMVTDDQAPQIVMFDGDPYLRIPRGDVLAYQQIRPYRADCMVIEEMS